MVATAPRGDQRACSINRRTCFWSCSNLRSLSTDWLHLEGGLGQPEAMLGHTGFSRRGQWSGAPTACEALRPGRLGHDLSLSRARGLQSRRARESGATGCARTQSPLPGETTAVPSLALHPCPGVMMFVSGYLVMPKCLAQSLGIGSPHGRRAAGPVGLRSAGGCLEMEGQPSCPGARAAGCDHDSLPPHHSLRSVPFCYPGSLGPSCEKDHISLEL